MNKRTSAVLLFALVLSAGATYLIYRLAASRVAQASPKVTKVIMASHPLGIGTLIKDLDLTTGDWLGTPPAGAVLDKQNLIGRGVISQINAGEVIFENRLAAPGAGGGLAATIPPGMRACAVKVNEIVGVAGFVVPGMRVDVLISGVAPGANAAAGAQVRTLLQNIEVLSAGQNYQRDAEGKPVSVPVVNLLVTPEQAEVLSLASNETKIQLVLRNPLDTEEAQTKGTAMAALFSGPAAPPVPRPRPAVVRTPAPAPAPVAVALPYRVEVFNGARKSETQFPRPDEETK